MDFYQFSVPTRIVFNAGLSRDFAAELEAFEEKKFFLITDKGLAGLKVPDPIIEGIKSSGREVCGVFSDVPADSGVGVIERCATDAKTSGAEALIAVGGGSVMDTAKGANILFTLGGDLVADYSGAQTIGEDLSPLIAIPTTAGTGSEVTEAMVILDETTHNKLSFVDSHLLPRLAILDPELTLGLPPKITAATAMDALTHAIEAVMSVQRGPVSDALAFQAVSLISENVACAVRDGKNLSARSALLVASNLAGMAFNHSMVGVVHSVAHTIGGMFRVHHGTANGIFLPQGMEYNLDVREKEIASLAPFLGIVFPSPLMGEGQGEGDLGTRKTAEACIEAVKKILRDLHDLCGLPTTLKEVGITKKDLEKIAQKAPEDGSSFYNPREINAQDLLPYLEKSF